MAGSGFHEAGSKQAERDMKKNSVLEKCAVPFLRLRTDGSEEKEKIVKMGGDSDIEDAEFEEVEEGK